jgi:hypothetical protein
MRVNGTRESDWTVKHEDVQERFKTGQAELASGNRMGFAKLLYARYFYKDGQGDYEGRGLLNNDLLVLHTTKGILLITQNSVRPVLQVFGANALFQAEFAQLCHAKRGAKTQQIGCSVAVTCREFSECLAQTRQGVYRWPAVSSLLLSNYGPR